MRVTQLFAHLERRPNWTEGDTIKEGCLIGRMGDTGFSALAHIHMGNALGEHNELFHLSDFESRKVIAVPRQLNYFLDEGLFDGPFKVTVPFADYKYQEEYGKVHSGYDVSTIKKWPWTFYWNRSMDGRVTKVGFDKGYGNYILISYDM